MHPNLPLLGIVLAGGQSTRMGQCKAALPASGGRSFLQRAIGELSRCTDLIAVSANPAQTPLAGIEPAELNAEVTVIVDQASQRGPAEGLLRGMEFAITNQCTGVLLVPVDLPFLPDHELRAIVDAFCESPTEIAIAVSERSPDRLEPLVALYPVTLREELESLVSSDDRSLYRFVQRHPHRTVRLSARALTNINEPHDWPTDELRVRTP